MTASWVVFRKALLDALRDRRTLLMVLISSVAIGPLVLVMFSTLVSGIEKRAELRQVWVQGAEHAPTLRNYLERQTYTLRAAPTDFERQIADSKLGEPVLVLPADFEAQLAAGEAPVVELVSSSSNPRAEGGAARIARLLQGFNQEVATLRLAVRGVSPAALQALQVEDRDLANPAARARHLDAELLGAGRRAGDVQPDPVAGHHVRPFEDDAAVAPNSLHDVLEPAEALAYFSCEVSGVRVAVSLSWEPDADEQDRRVAEGLLTDWAASSGGVLEAGAI